MAALTIWQRASAMVIRIDHDAELAADRLYRAGVRGVFVWAHDGITQTHTVTDLNHYFAPYIRRGMVHGLWGVLRTNPVQEAKLASDLLVATKGRFYVANPEQEYKYTGPDGQPDAQAFLRSQTWVNAFRALRPQMTLGVSSYGRYDQADLHWAAWLNGKGNARACPQAYYNEQGPAWRPALCYKGAIDVKQPWNKMYHPTTGAVIPGFPKSYVHVTLPKPDLTDAYPYSIDDIIADQIAAKQAGHYAGFSMYEAENWKPEEIAKMGAAIKQHGLARIDS